MKTLTVVIFCVLAINATAQNDAKQILLKADSAKALVRSATYFARYESKDSPNAQSRSMEGNIFLKKIKTDDKLAAKVKLDVSGKAGEQEFSYGYIYDGKQLLMINPNEKKATFVPAKYKPSGMITSNTAIQFLSPFLEKGTHEENMEDMISTTSEGIQEIEGIPCYVVSIRYKDNEYFSDISGRYFYGVKDYLLRREESSVIFNGEMQSQSTTITKVQINRPLKDSFFKTIAPKGFVQVAYEPYVAPKLLKNGESAPDWTLEDGNGKEVSLKDFRGKIVVMDFWYTTCGWCIKSMPALQKVHEQFASKDVVVLGVNARKNDKDPVGFMQRKKLTYPIVLAGDAVAEAYHISGYPTLYIIGKSGEILANHVGYSDNMEKDLTEKLEGFLKAE